MDVMDYGRKSVRKDIGWVYPELKFLTKKEAKLANRERDALLKSLSKEVRYSFLQNKIHIGDLSAGCAICGEGYWSCFYINRLCTAHCFYCPQDRKVRKEYSSRQGQFSIFTNCNPKTYIAFLKRFNFKGVGISGGETFLVFERLLLYIRRIRKKFGKKMYIWIYTNGDLVNKNKLNKLKEAGLDEIRFDISARNYDLQPVELATEIMDIVTVEIPAIPEDYEIVKKCLPKMQKIGIKHLNLHQLITTSFNYKNLMKRGYTFLHQANVPIFESEITALKLMRHALDRKIDLPINYCSVMYKNRIQSRGDRRWRAPIVKYDFEELTNCKYIRRLSIQDSSTKIRKIIKILQKNKCRNKLWLLDDSQNEISIHSSLLRYVDFTKYSLTVTYFAPETLSGPMSDGNGKLLKLDSHNKIFIKRELVSQQKLTHPATIKSFQRLFLDNIDEREVLHDLYRKFDLTLQEWREETRLLLYMKRYEYVESGFPYLF